MPTYGYRCDNSHEFEVFQGISEDPLKECQVCGSPVRRIFYPVGIVFKGPGFYKTDSRGGSSSSTPAATPAGSDNKAETKAETKADSTTSSETKPKAESKTSGAKSEKKSA